MNILNGTVSRDDQLLEAGAAIICWVREGHQVSVLFSTDGMSSRRKNSSAAKIREKAAQKTSERGS
jgi:LmbE family N-acetylglucosaminyl deacetylase